MRSVAGLRRLHVAAVVLAGIPAVPGTLRRAAVLFERLAAAAVLVAPAAIGRRSVALILIAVGAHPALAAVLVRHEPVGERRAHDGRLHGGTHRRRLVDLRRRG